MIIVDLEFLNEIELVNLIIGGTSTSASTQTTADEGYANGQASAIAIGESTYANTNTKTSVRKTPLSNISKAQANADSQALDENSYSRSSSKSTSVYIQFKA